MNPSNKIETRTSTIHIDGGILYSTFKQESDITLEDLTENYEARVELQKKQPKLVLIDARGVWQLSNEAREFAGKDRYKGLSTAMAIVTDKSMGARIIANFYIKLNTPSYPTKLFNSKQKAMEWLESFK